NFNSYGLDGQPALHILNNDFEPGLQDGETAYLVLSQRRGGRGLWGLNVTEKDAPGLLWVIDGSEAAAGTPLSTLGQTWSTPVFSKVEIDGLGERTVAIIGGGYDDGQDNVGYHADAVGNSIFMIDIENGNVLWSAGGNATVGHNLPMNTGNGANATMQHGVAAPVKAIDLSGDGFVDRMYATDLGGRIWRFDVENGESAANLVSGGLIANLGGAESGQDTDARRFYAAPDIVFVPPSNSNYEPYLAINVGSGHRAKPLDESQDDWFFSVRDRDVYNSIATADYNGDYVQFADLVDITDDTEPTLDVDAAGWKLEMEAEAGERVLSESFTFAGTTFITSFAPAPIVATCGQVSAGGGNNRLYRVRVTDGAPDAPDDEVLEEPEPEDRYTDLATKGIAPSPVLLFTEEAPELVLCVGVECGDAGVSNNLERTYWFQDETQ
ncbi:MAG: PilC/PilY family type IV pilus protein, partial [Gammaproteobacteria bacterium]